MRSLQDKVALVTGASSGIGLEVARKLSARGVRLALVARTRDKLEAVAAELGAERGRAAAFPLDVSDLAALEALPAKVVERLGGCDILVNNAGLNHRGPILQHTPAFLAQVIATNLSAPIVLTRAAIPHMQGWGAVIHIASLAGILPVPDSAAYSASKAGLRAFAGATAVELRPRGIHVAIISPGPVDTPFFGDIEEVPPLVFSQPMSTAVEVADAVLRAIDEERREIALPRLSGVLAAVGSILPGLVERVRPLLNRRGEVLKRRYMEKKRAEAERP